MSASIQINTNSNFSSSSNRTYNIQIPPTSRTISGPCNESKKHDNDEKAAFHGLKSAWRMSREYDGREYGSRNPQYEAAAGIAANVALAYFRAKDVEYDREASHEYLVDKGLVEPKEHTLARLFAWFTDAEPPPADELLANTSEFSDALDQAWTQMDDKWHHDDAMRTALAAAELYLGKQFEVIN